MPVVSGLGDYSYEVVDTKLARTTKSKFLVQLAVYSDLVAVAQAGVPHAMHVVLGDGREQSFSVAEYGKYTAQLKERFLERIAAGNKDTYPQPCSHCSVCRWRDVCDARWVADDHLSQVAGITRIQIGRLEEAGITTMANLARSPAGLPIPRMNADVLSRLRDQASLQVGYRESGVRDRHVIDRGTTPLRGFARLPRPDPHDLFFDIEGDPLEDGGLEYLLGLHYLERGKPEFETFWAHSRAEERTSFEALMDFVAAWLVRFPQAHIYHYAPYEESALKRLMSVHGTREAEVDSILREGRLDRSLQGRERVGAHVGARLFHQKHRAVLHAAARRRGAVGRRQHRVLRAMARQ